MDACQRQRISLIAGLCLAALASTQAWANYEGPTAAELSVYENSSEADKVKLLIQLSKNGDHEFADRLLLEYPLSGPFAANRTLYIKGLILKARGDLTGAAKNFRLALADDPKLTMVRADLAKTLVELDQDDSAKHHLELLAAEAPDQQSSTAIRSFIEKVDAKNPFKFSGFLSIAPSTNINGGGNSEIVYLPQFGNIPFTNPNAKKSGLGVTGGVNAAFSRRLGNKTMGVVTAGASANIYGKEDANSGALSSSAELRFLTGKGYLSAGLVGSYQNIADADDRVHRTSFGPRLGLVHQLGLRDTVSASAVLEKQDYTGSILNDGYALRTSLGLTHAIDSSFNISTSAGFDRTKVEGKLQSYSSYSFGLGAYKELSHGITADVSTRLAISNYDGIHALTGDNRHDKRLTSRLELTKRDLNLIGFAPALSYTYTRNWSDVVLYDYDSHAVDFRLTKDF